MGNYTRSLAIVSNSDIILESDHGWLMWKGRFEYEDGGCQGLGFYMHASFIKGLLAVFGYDQTITGINGKSCWVTHDNSDIIKIEPLHAASGKIFDIRKWRIETDDEFEVLKKWRKEHEKM